MDQPSITCPSCGKELTERGTNEIDVPHFGKVIHYFMRCTNCGFRINDFSYEGSYPEENKMEIKEKKDLYTKIVRGPKCTVEIPELGLELYPGPIAESFVTNIQGLLERFLTHFSLFENREDAGRVETDIRNAIEGRIKFSVILNDPSGVSHFIED